MKSATFGLVEMTPEQISDILEGPIRHELLPADLQETVEWTFEVVGHYFHNSLEQWEVGFLRDTRPEAEIGIWVRIALAFERYHRERGMPRRDDDQERDLIARLVEISTGVEPTDEEGRFIRSCYLKPDLPRKGSVDP